MRSCEFVCVINVRNSTATFQFISEELQNLAPHWRQDEEMDFDENMRQPLSLLVRKEFRAEMLSTFNVPYIVKQLEVHSPFITTFDLVAGEHSMRKQVQYFWIDDTKEEILCIQTDISVAYEKELFSERLKHEAGDMVLKHIAKIMSSYMEQYGFAGRMGGEEFVLAFRNMTLEESLPLLNEIRTKIEETPVPYGSSYISATMTFGAAEYNSEEGIHALITNADTALYYGKEHGRNQVVPYTSTKE